MNINKMMEIKITDKHKEMVQKISTKFKTKNSITKNEGNGIGILGEVILLDYLNVPLENYHSNKDYDFLYKGKKIDVKTKKVSSKPKENYYVSVAATSSHQQCDGYMFIRIDNKYTTAWICGYASKQKMFNGSFFLKGQTDPTSTNGWRFKADCFNLTISELDDIKKDVSIKEFLIPKNVEITEKNSIKTSDWFKVFRNGKKINIKVLHNLSLKETIIKDEHNILFRGFLKTDEDIHCLLRLLDIKIQK